MPEPGPAPPTLAEQALANLVNQFARPLDFLRELAQNSIDAGSPRIEVTVSHGDGVLEIHVDDFGEGMDEDIIDNQLTRLFSSSKEDDLTKIGKFGIGFTSIFAILPDAVLLRTGRHGEYWELLFHADRSFDKERIDEPVQGTRITLYKRMPSAQVEPFVQEIRFVLDYWCEHSDTPITFADHTRDDPGDGPESDDPFAAFAESARRTAERVNRPITIDDASLLHQQVVDGIEVAVGYAAPTRFGFYNGGLTLLNTQNVDILGDFRPELEHLSFKVKHDALEHTITRDNVLHDENWRRAMRAVVQARTGLRAALVERLEQAVTDGEPLSRWHDALAAECRTPDPADLLHLIERRPLFRDLEGRPRSLAEIRTQEGRLGGVLVAGKPGPLAEALVGLGLILLEDDPSTRALLLATEEPPLFEFLQGRREIKRANEVFVLPALVDEGELEPMERRLLARTEELLGFAVGVRLSVPFTGHTVSWAPSKGSAVNRLTIRVGDFGGMDLGRHDVLALNGPTDGRVFLRPEPSWFRLPSFLSWRALLVNRYHPLFRAQLLASAEDLDVAAYGLASALLHTERIEGEGAYRRMLAALTDVLLADTTRAGR